MDLFEKNIKLTKKLIRESINQDNFIVQTINCIEELNRTSNTHVKRLREWYSLHNPESSHFLKDNEKFTELILKKSKSELLKEFNITDSMGANLEETDLKPILNLATQIKSLYQLKTQLETYLETVMKTHMPNTLVLTGPLIGAKLLEIVGSLKRLSQLPASTVQLLGAEKALFRHMRSKAKPPKYGILFTHPLVQKAFSKGKTARALADKISVAAKVDYFKGEFIGDKLLQDLQKRFK